MASPPRPWNSRPRRRPSQRRPPSLPLRTLSRLGVGAIHLFAQAVATLPPARAIRVGRWLGDGLWYAVGRRRKVALDNLALAFGGERSEGERRAIARESFRHLGIMTLECFRLLVRGPAELAGRVVVEGAEYVEQALGEGGGGIFLTAHLGNWELLAASAFTLKGWPISVVARPLDNPALERLATEFRQRFGLRIIPKRKAAREVLAALRGGGLVGVLLDQNTTVREGVFVPFFGRPASTSKSLALLSRKSGVPVFPVFIRRLQDGRHHIGIHPPILTPRTQDREKDVREGTALFTQAIEASIRQTPEQWLWLHRRWKTRPPGEIGGP